MTSESGGPIGSDQANSVNDEEPEGGAWGALGSGVLFEQAMAQTRMAICITDPHAADNPIVFANRAFLKLSGYERDEVIGRNCRFMQGDDTDMEQVEYLRRKIDREEVCVVELLNHRKDGSTFWNALHVGPIYDEDGKLKYFFGSQWDVTNVVAARTEAQQQRILMRELNHRIKNLFAVISSIVTLSGRNETSVSAVVDKTRDRVMALGRAHEATLSPSGSKGEPADLHTLIETVLRPYRVRTPGRLIVDGPYLSLPSELVTPLGLVLHELATNAVKHGALGVAEGSITVRWRDGDGLLKVEWEENGGPRPDAARTEVEGMGSRIVRSSVASVNGTIRSDWREQGLLASITMPFEGEHAG